MRMDLLHDWSKLGGLMFAARCIVDGLYPGSHLSSQRGGGLEFYDYRPYVPGDSPAGIDWKLYGRTDRYYLRRYRQLTDLHVYLMVDRTASMGFPVIASSDRQSIESKEFTKYQYASLLAATIAFITVRQSDRVALNLFTDKVTHHLPPQRSIADLRKICSMLETTDIDPGLGAQGNPGTENPKNPGVSGAGVAAAIAHAHHLVKRRGLFVLISDLLDDPKSLFDGLNRLRHHHFDVVVFQVLSRREVDLSRVGSGPLLLRDPETGGGVRTNVQKNVQKNARTVQDCYTRVISRHLSDIKDGCLARGVDYQLIFTDHPVISGLRGFLGRSHHAMG